MSDLVGLVAGYSLASWLARSFWPKNSPASAPEIVAVGFEFAWLGLAMSGPLVLLLDRGRASTLGRGRTHRQGPEPGEPHDATGHDYSRAELAWLAIGGYWISLTLFVVPVRSGDAPWFLMGVVNLAMACVLMIVPRSTRRDGAPRRWTHRVAVVLLWTLPIAWLDLVLIAKSML